MNVTKNFVYEFVYRIMYRYNTFRPITTMKLSNGIVIYKVINPSTVVDHLNFGGGLIIEFAGLLSSWLVCEGLRSVVEGFSDGDSVLDGEILRKVVDSTVEWTTWFREVSVALWLGISLIVVLS